MRERMRHGAKGSHARPQFAAELLSVKGPLALHDSWNAAGAGVYLRARFVIFYPCLCSKLYPVFSLPFFYS